jgi:hypothetical protein
MPDGTSAAAAISVHLQKLDTSATIDRCPNEKYTQSCKYYGSIILFLKSGKFRLINIRIFMRV